MDISGRSYMLIDSESERIKPNADGTVFSCIKM